MLYIFQYVLMYINLVNDNLLSLPGVMQYISPQDISQDNRSY